MSISNQLSSPAHFRLFGTLPIRSITHHFPFWDSKYRRLSMLTLVLIAWVPLLLLSTAQGHLHLGARPFYNDFAVHARVLLALPPLLLGRIIGDHVFSRAVEFLNDSGAVPAASREDFQRHLQRFATLRDSWASLFLLIAAAYLFSAFERHWPINELPSWKIGANHALSLAGGWYFYFVRPLILTQVLSWIWTFGLWSWLLGKLVSLPIRVFAYHPDQVGGLEPIISAHRVFAFASFALSADIGGALANRLMHEGEAFVSYRAALVCFVLVLTVVVLSPLFLFSILLIPARFEARHRLGLMGFALSRKIDHDYGEVMTTGVTEPMQTTIQAHADSRGGEEIVSHTRLIPVTREYVLWFLMAALIPLVPTALVGVPVSTVVERLKQLLMH